MLFLCLLSKGKEEAKAVGCSLFFSELRLINDCDEGTESVAGDGERKKWVYLELGQSGEGEKEQSFMLRSEVGWGGFLCALFEAEVLTEGP